MADKVKTLETDTTSTIVVHKNMDDVPKTPSILIGVYGTLKKGFFRHDSLGMAKQYVGAAPVPGIMFHLIDYPMVCKIPEYLQWRKDSAVSIEIYRIETSQLVILDGIEGHPNFFRREEVSVSIFPEKVWVYYGHSDVMFNGKKKLIPGNHWKGATTSYVEADFGNGNVKPHLIMGRERHIYASDIDKKTNQASISGLIVDATTGEIEGLDMVNVTPIATPTIVPNPNVHYTTPAMGTVHRDYKTKTWDAKIYDYVNEDGKVLKWCNEINDFALAELAKSREQVWQDKQKKLLPSVIQVPKGEPLDGEPFPRVVEL